MLFVGAGDISGPNEVSTICYLLSTDQDNDGSAILDLSEAAEANILEVGDALEAVVILEVPTSEVELFILGV